MVHVLVVDDFEPWRRFVKRVFLKDQMFTIVGSVSDGLAAIEESARLQPHLVILDIDLPGRSGIEAAREIRKLHPHVHIVLLSIMLPKELVDAGLELGARGFVAKYDGNELLRAAKAVIEGQQYMSRSIRERYSHGSEPASGCHKS